MNKNKSYPRYTTEQRLLRHQTALDMRAKGSTLGETGDALGVGRQQANMIYNQALHASKIPDGEVAAKLHCLPGHVKGNVMECVERKFGGVCSIDQLTEWARSDEILGTFIGKIGINELRKLLGIEPVTSQAINTYRKTKRDMRLP